MSVVKAEDVKRVAVLGAGTMGHGIAQVCAAAGLEVALRDVEERFVEAGLRKIQANLEIGVQKGNTSGPIAEKLVADGAAAKIRVYDYGSIRTALDDLTTGGCDAFMKLAPVLAELVKPFADVEVVQRGISSENIAIAVGRGDQELLARIAVAQAELEEDGTLQRIRRKWIGSAMTS